MQISRTHPDRQRFALEQARAGRDPLGKPPAGVEPPFDTLDYGEVVSRLRRNAGALDRAADLLLAAPSGRWPGAALDAVRDDAQAVLAACRGMSKLLRATGGRDRLYPPPPWHGSGEKPHDLSRLRGLTSAARGVTGKNLRDLPRLLRESPPPQAVADGVLHHVLRLRQAADRLRAVLDAGRHDPAAGPPPVPGTYVAFYRLDRPVRGLRVGRLGVFDFPPGVYAYLGSAFGGGGVRKRTGRHLTRRSRERWNIDWLKPRCVPVEVWWTHDRRKVEFGWAGVLAALPGASAPARRFGGNDNRAAEAHLLRFDRVPSLARFARMVAAAMPGHFPVHRKVVENWTGNGWPG